LKLQYYLVFLKELKLFEKVQNAIYELKAEGNIETPKLLLESTGLSSLFLSNPHIND